MPTAYILLQHDEILLMDKEGTWHLPSQEDIQDLALAEVFPLAEYHGIQYHVARLTSTVSSPKKLFHFREAFDHLGQALFQLVGRARQLLDWRLDHQFCGRCGTAMNFFDQGRAKKCPACDLINYPRISPCMLVAVTRGEEILLARSAYFRPEMFSVLAGFVEAGESLEACVHREVFEEVGLNVKHLRYLASQSWPFPNLLMVGFMAEYDSGEIQMDPSEIAEAKWFKKTHLPPVLPKPFSLSYALIQQWVKS